MVLVNNIDQSCGWVTKSKSAESVRETLRAILAMTPEELTAMKQAARRRAEAHFSLENMVNQTNQVYAAIMKK